MALGQSVESFEGPAMNRRLVSQQEGVSAVESGVQAHQVTRATSWPSIRSKRRAVTFFLGSCNSCNPTPGESHPWHPRNAGAQGHQAGRRQVPPQGRALTFRPSRVCGLLASTVPTQFGSLNLTQPKPRDWLVVLSFMITQSTTSPYWER